MKTFCSNRKLTVGYGKSALWNILVSKITIAFFAGARTITEPAIQVYSLLNPIQCVGNHTQNTKQKQSLLFQPSVRNTIQ